MMRGRHRLLTFVVVAFVLARGSGLGGAETIDQTARLAALARVWGLLKYFHPLVAQGTSNWDAVLVDEFALIKAADTKPAFNDEIVRLIQSVDPVPRVAPGAPLERRETDAAFSWIDDEQIFDPATIHEIKTIRNAVVPASNRYVTALANVPNPNFGGETPYDTPAYPSEGMRFLAPARFWNMMQYYAPNRDITDRNWSDVLPALVPRFLRATDANDYHLAVCELTASLNDTYAFTSSPTLTALWGVNTPPIATRFIESQTVVTTVYERLTGGADVRPGDLVTDINGVATADVRARLRPYVWASNEGSLQRNIDGLIFRTNASAITLGISRFGVRKEVVIRTMDLGDVATESTRLDAQVHDRSSSSPGRSTISRARRCSTLHSTRVRRRRTAATTAGKSSCSATNEPRATPNSR